MALRITVIGTGYLGAVHAAGMAELGHDVLGVDVDEHKVATLNDGRAPFFEPGLEPLLAEHVGSGRLRFTTSFSEAAEFGDVHFLCVGTPQQPGSGGADLRYVHAAIDALAPHLHRPALIAGKSTVPVGTAEQLAARVAAAAPAGEDVHVAWNPEFLREGFAVEDTLRPDRLVFGIRDAVDAAVLERVYASVLQVATPLVVTDLPTAELVKVAANSFLATKISFINAMAEVCEAAGADVVQLSQALAHDERIGGKFLKAGLGFGGGCLPKDIRAFTARAGELGAHEALNFLREVDEVNMRRRTRVVDLVRSLLGGSVLGSKIAVLGAAFKPNTDDVRDSPALNVAATLHLAGAQVVVHDPQANANAAARFPTLTYSPTTADAVAGADVIVLATEWEEFTSLDPSHLGQQVAYRRIVDARNVLDPQRWADAGWAYRGMGRPAPTATIPAPMQRLIAGASWPAPATQLSAAPTH
ncbi:UDP-glucose/GDP-mannose dehydrogenase family protein [Georgenia sp. SYP-B2076]|uniref:UDP-glucose dehydrogenase family protein n=1 Tax=Georgenia sp. SYP-B2076 TaxID=2495881 RepID=UPI000F8F375B|nr:UDP-glucose/GDP-mannose dehydrogenase family protein [Georgenia sp. SYP-B2076]